MTRTLYLHIGAQRTATSSLQAWLHGNPGPLRRQGFLYPYKVRRHQALTPRLFSGPQAIAEIAAEITAEAEAAQKPGMPITSVILSDEAICRRPDLAPLAALRDHFDVRLVYFLRRQDLWLESWYLQNIKWQWDPALCHLGFEEFLARRDAFPWIHYDGYLARAEAVFGPENLRPCVFEKEQMPDGPIAAFRDLVGLRGGGGFAPAPHVNSSLSPMMSEFMRRLPLDEAPEDFRGELERACTALDREIGDPGAALLLAHDRRAEILADYADGNRALAQRHFGRDDLFLAPLPGPDAAIDRLDLPADSDALMDRLVAPFLRQLIAHRPVEAMPPGPRPGLADEGDDSPAPWGQPGAGTGVTVLQNVVFPEPGICTETDLFFRLTGSGAYRQEAGLIHLAPGAKLGFDTYFNAFNYGKWRRLAGLDSLALLLRGKGRVALRVVQMIPGRSAETIFSDLVTLTGGDGVRIDLARAPLPLDQGMLAFEITALAGPAVLRDAAFATADPPRRKVRLALSITTFRREDMVRRTAARIDGFLDRSAFGADMHLFVVDNGDSAELPDSPRITRIVNPNLGGAGGFSRGLLEAEAQGFSHVLFMDDDASVLLDAVHRTHAMLSFCRDDHVAVAGAMINSHQTWRMWENAAVFDGKCMPRFTGVDLRDAEAMTWMEVEATRPAPDKTYGGWWFFAFPIAHVERHPFPFFVRGDDVNFCLANPFQIVTLNGVVSFAEDFTDKESPLNWYLDLRSHMVHHLTLEKMRIGRIRVAKIGVWFFLRNLARFQYDTIEAVLLAWEDVLRGPDFFVRNADMAERRAQIRALTRTEAWKPLADLDPGQRVRYSAANGWRRRLFRLSLNGHLLPFFGAWGNRVVIPPQERGFYHAVWGSSRITYLNGARDKGYTTQQSKRRFAVLSLRLMAILARFLWRYPALLRQYRARYPEIASRGFWQETLKIGEISRDGPRDMAR